MIQKPRGTYDYYGDEFAKRYDLQKKFVDFYMERGFKGLETPLLEQRSLFVRSVGEETDIVSKELFDLEKKSDEIYSLRPEFTAGVIRALIEMGIKSMPKPIKVFSFGPCFRYERPQKGRKRQFNQFNIEMIGKKSPEVDLEIIESGIKFLQSIGLKDLTLNINSLGSSQTRTTYSRNLAEFFKSNAGELCETCNIRMVKNPLRVLDCKDPNCKKIVANAPSIIENLTKEEKTYYDDVVSALKEKFNGNDQVKINEDPLLVRGLDYYTGVIFEFSANDDESRMSSIGGGGRYDELVRQLDGPDTPAVGMGFGFERIVEFL